MKKGLRGVVVAIIACLCFMGLIYLPGTQPFEGRTLDVPGNCGCHKGYDTVVEPFYNWQGSMMAQAARDPIFYAGLDIANADAVELGLTGGVGSFCLRCHSPRAHLEGRTDPPDGSAFIAADMDGVFCDFCHALVDPLSAEGQSLITGNTVVTSYGNAQYVITNGTEKRGPFDDAEARHVWMFSPYHRTSEVCGICHDVSNPTLCDPADPFNVQKCFTEQRTYSEWKNSWYATQGEAGNCQACHMPHVQDGKGCKQAKVTRTFLPVHHQVGGNTFVPDAIAVLYAGDNAIDFVALAEGKQKAISLLQQAAQIEAFDVTDTGLGRIDVRVTNLTGHKLPTGYPEGRRMWINIAAHGVAGSTVFESGAYDLGTALLNYDDQVKIYEAHFGIEQPDGSCQHTFRLVKNNCLEKDNRIPPKGFDNAAFDAVGAGHAHYHYADGQFWDDTPYTIPASAVSLDVRLYYQTTSLEYIEFLATDPYSGQRGQDLINVYNSTGKAPPVLMASTTLVIDGDTDGMGDAWELAYGLDPANPADAAGDLDGDGLSNLDEYLYGSLPDVIDSDGDGLSDGDEVHLHLTDPIEPDTDGDGLIDGDEVNVYFTNPLDLDSDGGGEGDGSEVAGGRDPLDPADDGEMAEYLISYTAPGCTSGKSPCIVPEALIAGRDTILNGNEPNQPNTVAADPCADGEVGEYHSDESIDAVMVTDLASGQFHAGDPIEVKAKVWCWTDVGLDEIHIFRADSADSPAWVYMGSTACPAVGDNTLTVTGNLGASAGNQVIRVTLAFDSLPLVCDGASYSDHDDVVIAVTSSGDGDGDGLPDTWEDAHPCMQADTVDNLEDHDFDGLDNQSEYGNSTDPCSWDTDGDGLPDAYEISNMSGHTVNLDPLNSWDGNSADFDGDGNPNTHEYYNGSDPWSPDPTGSPGCRFWADSGPGEGILGPGDLTQLELELAAAGAGDYSGVIPNNADTQDLSGEGIMGPGDLTLLERILKNEVIGSELGSRPVGISVIELPGATVASGWTCHVSVVVNNESGHQSPGFGVVFEIDPSSTAGATLLGGDGDSVSGGRYDVTGPRSEGAKATMVLKVSGSGSVIINASMPQCGDGAGAPGRSCAALDLSPAAVISVK